MASAEAPTLESRLSADCPADIKQLLTLSWAHDLSSLKPLLYVPGRASVRDPETAETPLHAAIRACGSSTDRAQLEKAKAVVEELFLSGAIWNDVDNNNETPGCLAHRLGQKDLYQLCLEAGVRAELLFSLMDGYEELSSGDEEEEEEGDDDDDKKEETEAMVEDGDEPPALVPTSEEAPTTEARTAAETDKPDVNSEDYLRSNLTYDSDKLVDDEGNGVMMAWETSIMRASVDQLLPDLAPGKRILNIGFGMGIIDTMFHETRPARHHIIEAHRGVLDHIDESKNPESKFGATWEKSGPEQGAYKVWEGKWQDVVQKLAESGEIYDAIYFDTFGEDYNQLKLFFTEYVPALLDQVGKFGFFNGLGADRQICYDVYQKVAEMHLSEAGMDVEWKQMDVDVQGMGLQSEGEGEWKGVRRRYWTLDKYRLPVCTFLG